MLMNKKYDMVIEPDPEKSLRCSSFQKKKSSLLSTFVIDLMFTTCECDYIFFLLYNKNPSEIYLQNQHNFLN